MEKASTAIAPVIKRFSLGIDAIPVVPILIAAGIVLPTPAATDHNSAAQKAKAESCPPSHQA
jgi:hypothetical protein